MKHRVRAILQLLDSRQGYTTIERIAQATGAGVRTIHRDLERLERSLALRGVRIERRRGFGIRLIDPLPEEILRSQLGSGGDSGVDSDQRPLMILLYLAATGDWTKLSELALALFVSDSSISGDMTTLDEVLGGGVSIERQKGVGARLVGSELDIRFLFLACFPAVFPQYVLVSMQASDWNEAGSGSERLVDEMGLREQQPGILKAIARAEESLDLSFAPAYRSLLYGYLYLLNRRLAADHAVEILPAPIAPIPEPYHAAARAMLLGYALHGDVPEIETELLARILASCEVAVPLADRTSELVGDLAGPVNACLERTLAVLEEQERIWIHDDRIVLDFVRITAAAAIRRIELGIARWRSFVTIPYPDLEERSEAAILTVEFLQEFAPRFEGLSAADVRRELREIVFALSARIETLRRRRAGDVTVRILCYEGLGMSSYLDALVRELLPASAYVDATWDPQFARTSNSMQWDLVISTYPTGVTDVREVLIRSDQSPGEIRESIQTAIREVVRSDGRRNGSINQRDSVSEDQSGISIRTIMAVIRNFFILPRDETIPLLDQATNALDTGDCDRATLRADLERRESYGTLVFEDIGVRLVHCRTRGIPEPRAGVIRSLDESPTILVLAAPVTAPATETRVLSELVVALTETDGFARALTEAKRSSVRALLLAMYSHIIG